MTRMALAHVMQSIH